MDFTDSPACSLCVVTVAVPSFPEKLTAPSKTFASKWKLRDVNEA